MADAPRGGGAFERHRKIVASAVLLLLPWSAAQAATSNGPWSVTVYFGPSTTKFIAAVFTSGRFEATGAMVGVAADGRLLYLGDGVSIAAEVEATQYGFGHPDTTFSVGLGFQANAPFGLEHTRFSVYDGPSYATDPPYTSIGYRSIVYPATRVNLLNYVTLEYAVSLSSESNWDVVARLYHRSGAWGVYSDQDDDGVSWGLGLKYRF